MAEFNYVVTAQRPTAVTSSVVGCFTGKKQRNLIVAKCTRLEVYLLAPEGLQLVLDVDVYGRIAAMGLFSPPNRKMVHKGTGTENTGKQMLYILTEHYKLSVVKYDEDTGELVTVAKGTVEDSIGRQSDSGQIGILDPLNRCIALSLYDGMLKLIPILYSTGHLGEAYNVRLQEFQIIDVKFLYGGVSSPGFDASTNTASTTNLTGAAKTRAEKANLGANLGLGSSIVVAALSQDIKEKRHVRIYEVSLEKKDLNFESPLFQYEDVDPGANMIVPLPPPIGGLLVIGMMEIAHIGRNTEIKKINISTTRFNACGMIDSTRFILSDHMGVMYLLMLQHDGGEGSGSTATAPTVAGQPGARLTHMTFERLGVTSGASTLSYLDNGVVFVGSLGGDSQLVELTKEPQEEDKSHVKVLESWPNLGPIVDLAVVDLERQGQGQGQVVTCSGICKDGSLRIIRNGIGINETATIELPGMKGIWSMKSDAADEFDTFLVVTFVAETRVLAITDDELDEVMIDGFEPNDMTVLCGNCCHGQLLQVTQKTVRLVDGKSQACVAEWRPPALSDQANVVINMASMNDDQVLLATGGGRVILVAIGKDSLDAIMTREMPTEVACVYIGRAPSTATSMPLVAAVGLWSNEAHVVSVPGLETITKEHVGGDSAGIIPRSILMCTLEDVHYLLCALGDGHLFSFTVKLSAAEGAGGISLINKKSMVLGSQPITLSAFNALPPTSKAPTAAGVGTKTSSSGKDTVMDGQEDNREGAVTNIFACSDRPAVVHSSNRKQLLYSNVNMHEITMMCPFHCSSFPNSLALANEKSLTIGTIESVQKLHIRTVPLGEQPRRIVHIEHARCFAVCCARDVFPPNAARAGASDALSCVTYCQVTVRLIDDQQFDTVDTFELLRDEDIVSCLYAQLEDDPEHYFIVGTAIVDVMESDVNEGRILVFSIDNDRKLKLVHAKQVGGSCYNLNAFSGGKLVAGLGGTINLYRWRDAANPTNGVADAVGTASAPGEPMAAAGPTSSGVGKELVWECSHSGHIIPLYVETRGDFIVCGDVMKSISLLMYDKTKGKIVERARDHNANYMTAVAVLDDDVFLGAENSFNIFTVMKNAEAASDEDRNRLDVVGEFHLGEFVNRFRKGSLVMRLPDSELSNQPTLVFGTINGVIGVIVGLTLQQYQFLEQLQHHLRTFVRGVAGLSSLEWRKFSNERRNVDSRGFIDGNLIESFVELSADVQQQIVDLMNAPDGKLSVPEICDRLFEYSRLH